MAYTGFDSVTYRDYDRELSNVRVHVTALTAANFDAQATLRNTFEAAMDGITIGVRAKHAYGMEEVVSGSVPADTDSQRELKWLVSYHDAVNFKNFSFEIPTAEVAVLDPNDRAHAEIGDADVVDAFVAAAEAYVLSPYGNAIVIDEITLVGRAL